MMDIEPNGNSVFLHSHVSSYDKDALIVRWCGSSVFRLDSGGRYQKSLKGYVIFGSIFFFQGDFRHFSCFQGEVSCFQYLL